MVAFVLVDGTGHGGWCWRFLVPLLRDRAHDVYTPTLTGMGASSHRTTFIMDGAARARKLKWNVYTMAAGRDVMITHPNELAELLLQIANK